jgi:hypothetical protein
MALFRNLSVNPPEADKSAGFLVPALLAGRAIP